jgi:diguanylate cyclase (GGDEF)-like protein
MRAMESSIEALRADAEHAHAEARTDALTGLPNLRRFAEDVGLLQDRVRRAGTAAAVLFLDLDEFGLVNRVFGQERGDRTLAAVAAVLSAECRAGDDVYRVGGEEFIVLLPGSDLEGGRQVAERMRGAVEVARIPHGGRSGMPIVTVSIGVAAVSGHAADMSQAITGANEGERRAKEAGRNRVFPPGPPVGAA